MAAASQSSRALEEFLATIEDRESAGFFKQIHQEFVASKERDDEYFPHQKEEVLKCMLDRCEKTHEETTTWAVKLHDDPKERIQDLGYGRQQAVDILESFIYRELREFYDLLKNKKKNLKTQLKKIYDKLYDKLQASIESDEERLLVAFQKVVVSFGIDLYKRQDR
jgi:hypothetical protein